MKRSEQAIFTNLVMVYDKQGNILVQDRKDPSWPGICFPGGHVEPGESFVASAIREVKEETGLTVIIFSSAVRSNFKIRTAHDMLSFSTRLAVLVVLYKPAMKAKYFGSIEIASHNVSLCRTFRKCSRSLNPTISANSIITWMTVSGN